MTGDPEELRTASPRVRLKPIEPTDIPILYQAELEGSMIHRWRWGGATPSPEQYAARLWQGVHSQYIVTSCGSGEPVGLVTCYSFDGVNAIAYVAALRWREGVLASAMFTEGFGLFISNLFASAPLRKLYLETPEYNIADFASAIRAGLMVEEARLLDYRYFRSRYWDMVILAISREAWGAFETRLSTEMG